MVFSAATRSYRGCLGERAPGDQRHALWRAQRRGQHARQPGAGAADAEETVKRWVPAGGACVRKQQDRRAVPQAAASIAEVGVVLRVGMSKSVGGLVRSRPQDHGWQSNHGAEGAMVSGCDGGHRHDPRGRTSLPSNLLGRHAYDACDSTTSWKHVLRSMGQACRCVQKKPGGSG
eukprot:353436-Chlamydomonas_euryale.AAC.17